MLTVTALTARIRQQLEQGFSHVRVIGEVSRFSKATSGHCYFTIKDAHAAISAVIWRSTVARLNVQPKDGEAFIFSGHLSVYEARGSYQLVVTAVELQGEGRLAAQLEQRKQQLAARGWFDAQRKQPIPTFPRHIVIVTSAQAAALQDVLKVLQSRPGWLRLSLAATPVQGASASSGIVKAMALAQASDADVLLLVRGGGSLEDLWCFNEEAVVQAVVASRIPVISGIGHEIDSTLVDYAADLRAATPSNAAELCCPSCEELAHRLPDMRQQQQVLQQHLQHRRRHKQQTLNVLQQQVYRQQDQRHHQLARVQQELQRRLHRLLQQRRLQLRQLQQQLHFLEPQRQLQRQRQHLHAFQLRLHTVSQQQVQQRQRWHRQLHQRLFLQAPGIINPAKGKWQHWQQRCSVAGYAQLNHLRQYWQQKNSQLHAMNPAQVLQRGYTLVQDADGNICSKLEPLHTGQQLQIHFADGSAEVQLEKKHMQSSR